MAAAQELPGKQLLIKVGNGATPEIFAPLCLINTERGIAWGSEATRGVTPDCDPVTPDAPDWQWSEVDGLMATITGAGSLHRPNVPTMDAWYRSGAAKNIQVWLGTDGYWEGAFKLTQWEVTGNKTGKAQASVTLESDGIVAPYEEA